MEGHRFAVNRIERGDTLRSWGLPFGRALHDIDPGSYLCNAGMLEALGGRTIDFALPPAANFADHIQPYVLDRENFAPGKPLAPIPKSELLWATDAPVDAAWVPGISS